MKEFIFIMLISLLIGYSVASTKRNILYGKEVNQKNKTIDSLTQQLTHKNKV